MEKLQLMLSKNVTKKEHKWLKRDFVKGEKVYLYSSNTYNCIGTNGLACSINGNEPFFELPITALQFNHEGLVYGIFMTESQGSYFSFYCLELPINRMEVLTAIQNNGHLIASYMGESDKALLESANIQVLKISIVDSCLNYETIQMKDIEPLF